jgi:hypothetical protein
VIRTNVAAPKVAEQVEGNTFVIPANLSDVAGMLTLATTLVKGSASGPPAK